MGHELMMAAAGGVLIGIASSMMLIFNGRVTGIAGIYNGALKMIRGDLAWRVAFVGGLFLAGVFMHLVNPDLFAVNIERSTGQVIIAGLLVGYGTVLGSGCTSGHGVCGLARLSPRSLVATVTFMIFGFLTASGFRALFLGE